MHTLQVLSDLGISKSWEQYQLELLPFQFEATMQPRK